MKRLNGFSLASASLGALTLSLGLSLVACGGDSSSGKSDNNAGSNGIDEYETLEDMVHCTKSHYGEIAHVAETDSIYECTSEGWVAADSSKIEELLSSSDSKSDKDDSNKSSSSSVSDSEIEKVDLVKVDSVTLSGVAEKGPFVKNSSVTLTGLDSTFGYTKDIFKGVISDDKGHYSISEISLKNQYAVLTVNGFFYNEISGKATSDKKIKLNALVDLSSGKEVRANVNLLTELEYQRALYLVKNEGFNVGAAKRRATKEILFAFGVKVEDISATDISLAGSGDETEGLFVASVAMLANRSTSNFQNALEDMAESFAVSGEVNDTLLVDAMDNLSWLDSAVGFANVATNIKSLNEKMTKMDSVLTSMWTASYGLPICGADNEETLLKNKNALSANYGAGYVCAGGRWHKSSAIDTELGLCVSKLDGTNKESESGEYYNCKNGVWTEITAEQYALGTCTKELQGSLKKPSSIDYICVDGVWREASSAEVKGGLCTADNKNKTVDAADGYYICNGVKWEDTDVVVFKIGPCDKAGTIKSIDEDEFFCTASGTWTDCDSKNQYKVLVEDGYTCEDHEWRISAVGEQTTGEVCQSSLNEKVAGKDGEYYVCLSGVWKEATERDYELKVACGENHLSDISPNSKFVCELVSEAYVWQACEANGIVGVNACVDGLWRPATAGEKANGTFCSSKNEDAISNGYVCEKKDGAHAWRIATAGESATGLFCTESNYRSVKNGYACDLIGNTYAWRAATDLEVIGGSICYEDVATISYDSWKTSGNTTVICYDKGDGYAWRVATEGDLSTKRLCTKTSNMYEIYGSYGCDENGWHKATEPEMFYGAVCNPAIEKKFSWIREPVGKPEPYRCTNVGGVYAFRKHVYETITDDGITYKIVDVGNQVWMAENLRYKYTKLSASGDSMSLGAGYSNKMYDSENYDSTAYYGRFYTWAAAVDSAKVRGSSNTVGAGYGVFLEGDKTWRGVCPSGWRLPSVQDWKTMLAEAGGSNGYAFYAVSSSYEYWGNGRYEGGYDRIGMQIIPAGYRRLYKYLGDYDWNKNVTAEFWTITDFGKTQARSVHFYRTQYEVHHWENTSASKNNLLSVRCIKNQ